MFIDFHIIARIILFEWFEVQYLMFIKKLYTL